MSQPATKTFVAKAKSFSQIPSPKTFPLIGNTWMYRLGKRSKKQYHLALLDLYNEYGPIVKENIGGKDIVHVFDPDDIKTIYSIEGKWPIMPPLQVTSKIHFNQIMFRKSK